MMGFPLRKQNTGGAKISAFWRKHPAWQIAAWVALTFALSTVLALMMRNDSTYHTGTWDDYSESLVFGRMLQMQQNQAALGGFMGVYTDEWGDIANRDMYRANTPVEPEQYKSYVHQSGLQGLTFGVVNKILSVFQPDGGARERSLYLLNSILFYAAALTVAAALWRRFGPAAGLLFAGALLCAPWLQRGMKDIYWCLWLWLLPLLAGLLLCRLARGRQNVPFGAYLAVFGACLVRCLCGFEFISTFLILCEAPLACCWATALCEKTPGGGLLWVKRMAAAGVAAVSGVAAALLAWLVQGWLYYGNLAESVANVAGAASSRMSTGDAVAREGVTIAGVLYKYIVADTTLVLQLGGAGVTLWQLLGTALVMLTVTAAALWALGAKKRLAGLVPALCVWTLSFLAPVSWLVLSKAHADIHTHLIPMLWQLAFVPGCCALAGLLVATLCGAARDRIQSKK